MLKLILNNRKYIGKHYMKQKIDSFLDNLILERGLSSNTLKAYKNDLYKVCNFLESQKTNNWNTVTVDTLNKYTNIITKEKMYQETTIARKIAAIKSFFSFLLEEGEITDNPSESISSPKIGRQLPKFLTEEQTEQLLKTAAKDKSAEGIRNYGILELLYATGLRVTELINLNISDINLNSAEIKCFGKGAKQRIVSIHKFAVQALTTYMETSRPKLMQDKTEKAFFINRRGERLTRQWIWSILKLLAKTSKIKIPITPHILRHSFATHLLRAGASVRHVQEMLGHADLSTTQVYTHITNDHLKKAFEKSHPLG